MKKRIISLMLAMLMLLAACAPAVDEKPDESKAPAGETTDSTQPEETEPKTAYELEIEERNGVAEDVPELTFDGEDFVIYGGGYLRGYNMSEGYSGKTFEDSVYERNIRIAERFDIDLQILGGDDYSTVSSNIQNSVGAGLDEYDLVVNHLVQMGMDVLKNVFLDFRTVPYVDFEKPWWHSTTDELLTVNNRTFLAFGAFNISALANTKVVYFNNDMAANYNIGDMIDVVLEGNWTVDKVEEITEGIYTDLNTNGAKDEGDRFGYIWQGDDLLYYQFAWGKTFVSKDETGNIVTDRYYDEKLISMCDKLYEYIYSRPDMLLTSNVFDYFKNENTLCATQVISLAGDLLNTEIDYSVLPLPKWDESQEKYLTAVDGGTDTQAILLTAKDLEKVGAVVEALNADTWKNVEYGYYEKVLKARNLQDQRNLQVLDMIMDGRVYDFGYIYGGWSWCTNGGGASDWLYTMMITFQMNNITSWVDARIKGWTRYITSVVDVFMNYNY